jgi:hypothetical protein
MNGVVLWSDVDQHKAVIWCEDQGELAFYAQKTPMDVVDLYEGDLICFDLTLRQNKRMVENPQILGESVCIGLAQSLAAAQPDTVAKTDRKQTTAQVIPFAAHLDKSSAKMHRAAIV